MLINLLAFLSSSTYKSSIVVHTFVWTALTTATFIPFHLYSGVHVENYIISYLALLFVTFTSVAAALYVSRNGGIERYAQSASLILIFAYIGASISLLASHDNTLLRGWYEHYYTAGVTTFRYGGFMYEASHFCLMASPLFIYFALTALKNKKHLAYLIGISIPLASTLSLGFFATLFLTFLIAGLSEIKRKSGLLKVTITFIVLFSALTALYLSSETISLRIDNILSGVDSSTKGRTVDAYILASMIAEQSSILFGVGPGQIKVVGASIIIDYYNYPADLVSVVRIPSSAAELLASYGITGLTLKILILLSLYIKTKVYENRFSNLLFIFFFIYQFYGSFMLSSIEIFCFALAFSARPNLKGIQSSHSPKMTLPAAAQL